MQNYKMWINNQRVDAESGKTFTVVNPATGEEFASVPLGGQPEVDRAVEAAQKAFPIWSKKPQSERSRILIQLGEAIKQHSKEFADLEVLDHGWPTTMADMVLQGSSRIFEYVAQTARSLMSEVIPVQGNLHVYIQREPIGVNALITPWNVPLNILTNKLAYALAVGNTCVIKPASIDCLSALKLADILEKSELPPGAVNIITGPGSTMGHALVSHPCVKKVSFTGSSATGKEIMKAASGTIKRVSLELGGKNPFIVFDDVDVDAVVGGAVPSFIFNSGQVCGAPGRFYVHENIYTEFVAKFTDLTKKMVVGDPMDPKTMVGPMVSAEQRDTVEKYIKSGIEQGAKLLVGGKRPTNSPLNKGYYVMPTVFCDVQQNMKIAREEIFGPVAVILKFSSYEEMVQKANDTTYGLTASIWTKDTARGMRMANDIEAGCIWLNAVPLPFDEMPWGGFKESGLGKENGIIGFEDVTQMKVVGVNIG
jgi:acyl-CoA reductase-like NAD-dependent aldehyde dehydrogenase